MSAPHLERYFIKLDYLSGILTLLSNILCYSVANDASRCI